MEHYGIQDPVAVSDSGSNIKCAIRLCGWDRFPCAAHTINLAVQDGLNIEGLRTNTETKFIGIIDKCKNIVKHFKHSVTATASIRENAAILEKQNPGSIGRCQQLIQEVTYSLQYLILTNAIRFLDTESTKIANRHLCCGEKAFSTYLNVF